MCDREQRSWLRGTEESEIGPNSGRFCPFLWILGSSPRRHLDLSPRTCRAQIPVQFRDNIEPKIIVFLGKAPIAYRRL